VAEGTNQTQPPEKSREQILKDLRAAGLLRLLDTPTISTGRSASANRRPARSESVVLPFVRPQPKRPAPALSRQRVAAAAYLLAMAGAAWLYFIH
jgi:hypothetical protein